MAQEIKYIVNMLLSVVLGEVLSDVLVECAVSADKFGELGFHLLNELSQDAGIRVFSLAVFFHQEHHGTPQHHLFLLHELQGKFIILHPRVILNLQYVYEILGFVGIGLSKLP